MGNQCQQPQSGFDHSQIHTGAGVAPVRSGGSAQSGHQSPQKSLESDRESESHYSTVAPHTMVPSPVPVQYGRCPPLRKPAPQFNSKGFFQTIRDFKLSDYEGKYLLLIFFPFDFSEVCRQEILAFSDRFDEFRRVDCELLGCSMDSQFVHQTYCERPRSEGGLQGLNYPLLSDHSRDISNAYGVVIEEGEEKGASYRAAFIIDRKQVLRHASINDLDVSIDVTEMLRMVKAFQYADQYGSAFRQGTQQSHLQQSPSRGGQTEDSGKKEARTYNPHKQLPTEPSPQPGVEMTAQQVEIGRTPKVVGLARRQSALGQSRRQSALGQSMPGTPGTPGTLSQAYKDLANMPGVNIQSLAALSGGGGVDVNGRKRSIMKKRLLFDRLGGYLQIKNIVEKFFKYVKEDSRINYFFTNVDMNRLVEHFSVFISQISGGQSQG